LGQLEESLQKRRVLWEGVLGLVISSAMAAMVVVLAVGAIRRGRLELGERVLDRGQALFWVVTVGALVGGTAIVVASANAYLEDGGGDEAPQVLTRAGVSVTFPGSWRPLPELEEAMGSASTDALAVGGDGAELLVLWPPARPVPDAGAPTETTALRDVADALENPALDYQKWEISEVAHGVIVDAEYPSPRGLVVARHLIYRGDEGEVRTVIATCSSERDVADCRPVVASLTLADAD
jgi:hypothetical protein